MQEKIPLVIGLGITGRSLVNYLASLHEEIIIIEDSIDNSLLNDGEHPNLKELGITGTPIQSILPKYIYRFRTGGQFG